VIVPGSASPLLLSSAAGYFLTKSLRFRSSASAYLNRTGGTSTSRRIHTFSFWTKYSVTGGTKVIASAGSDDNNREWLGFSDNNFYYQVKDSGNFYELGTSQVLRDPSAWYHLMVAVDTTQATGSNRVKMYINGVQVTAFGTSTYPPQNDDLFFNDSNGGVSYICALRGFLGTFNYDGYLAEFNFIDGQQLTPSSFGETSTTTGVWQPKKYTGTYGTNGFYLDFEDTSSTAALGYDAAGSNDWTVNNISLTSGSTYDSMTDVPTLTSATTANYCVLNPLDQYSNVTLSNANLSATFSAYTGFVRGTFALPSTGQWYWEGTVPTTNVRAEFGIATFSQALGVDPQSAAGCWLWYSNGTNSYKHNAGTQIAWGSAWTSGDIVGIAFDAGAGTLTYYLNGALQGGGAAVTGLTGTYAPMLGFGDNTSTAISMNFGQQPFAQTPPTGFVALNTFNLPTPTIGATASTTANKYMDVVLYSGNNSTQNIAVGFQPDWVWSKCRNVARSHRLSDAVRGSTRDLYSDTTDDEENNGSITSFISTGFSLDNATGSTYNTSGETYVSWAWKANGAGSANTAGTIASTVSANTTAGFSIVAYTGNGTNGATVGHGLGAKPFLIIEKGRTSTYNWSVQGCGELWTPVTSNLFLNGTSSLNANGAVAAPTSTVFTPSATNYANESGITNIAYCFAPVAGYSAFGSYTGNGSGTGDGPFIYTGFRPRFVMFKNRTQGSQWILLDTAINTYNVSNAYLEPNTADTQNTANTVLDILSNGFKLRNTGGTDYNESNNIYIYACFAEYPFKYANAR
jgi:hypothetical protein